MPCPSSRDLPDPRIKPGSPALQVNSLPSEPQGSFSHQIDGERTWAGAGQARLPYPHTKALSWYLTLHLGSPQVRVGRGKGGRKQFKEIVLYIFHDLVKVCNVEK